MSDDTLVVELEQTTRCCNPSCRAEIELPGPERRYCPRCGAVQVYECEACLASPRGLLRVAEDCECPRCGALYAQCTKCRRPIAISAEGPLRCPEGCVAGLSVVRSGAHEPLANAARTGSVVARHDLVPGGQPTLWRLGERLSRLACRFGRVYFATGRGTLRAVHEDSGQDVEGWQQHSLFEADPGSLATLGLRVSVRYVYWIADGAVIACAAQDGRPVWRLPTSLADTECAIAPGAQERLLLCGLADKSTLQVELYNTLDCPAGRPRLLRAEQHRLSAAEHRQPVVVPSCGAEGFLVTDLDGNVRQILYAEDKESRLLWVNPGYEYVSASAVVGRWAYLLVHSRSRGAAVVRLGLQDGSAAVRRLGQIVPAYIGLRATTQALYVFDGERDLYELDLTAPGAVPRPIFAGVEMVGDMALSSLIALEVEHGAWLVYLIGSPGQTTPRMVHGLTASRPDLPPPAGCLDPTLAVSDRRIFVADPHTGEVMVYGIPEA